jgi:spore coat protein CotH
VCKRFTAFLGAFLAVFAVASSARAQTANDLFGSNSLQKLEIWLNKSDWSKLLANFQINDYYPADVTWNGVTARNVGIRSRGRGSRSGTKPGLHVDINRYSEEQTFLGLKSFVLDNLTQDPSGIHEAASMAFMARAGVPAPREIHTSLFVNGSYAGLYVIVESIDKDFLARVFGSIDGNVQNDGYLYEFKYADDWRFEYLGSDLNEYKIRFDPKTHEGKSDEHLYRPIENLIRLINETPADRLAATIGDLFDIPAFIRYLAAQTFLAETDGFLGNLGVNNFYLYRLEDKEQHVLISWDSDNAFWGPQFSIDVLWNHNVLVDKLMSIPEYNALYITEIRRVVELAERDSWLETEIIRLIQRIDQAMKDDPLKPYSVATYLGSVGVMIDFARDHIAFVKCELEKGIGKCFQ